MHHIGPAQNLQYQPFNMQVSKNFIDTRRANMAHMSYDNKLALTLPS